MGLCQLRMELRSMSIRHCQNDRQLVPALQLGAEDEAIS